MRLVLPAMVILVVFASVGSGAVDSLPGCGFHRLTGLHCPGCGSTRALGLLLRGEILAAVGKNPLLVLGLPLLAVAWVRNARTISKPGRQGGDASSRVLWAVLGLVVLFWILRNVPAYPFTLLAP